MSLVIAEQALRSQGLAEESRPVGTWLCGKDLSPGSLRFSAHTEESILSLPCPSISPHPRKNEANRPSL